MRLESVKKQRTSRCRFIPKSRTTSLWLTKRDKNKKKGEKREATARKTLIQLQLKKFRAELFALSLLSSNSCWFVSGLLCSLSPGLSFSLSLSLLVSRDEEEQEEDVYKSQQVIPNVTLLLQIP